MVDTAQEYKDKYEVGRVRLALALKNLCINRLTDHQWRARVSPVDADPYLSPSFRATVAQFDLSRFESYIPKLAQFTQSAYRDWRYQTLNLLSESEDISQKEIARVFGEHPSLETGIAADAALVRKTELERTRTLQIVMGCAAALALVSVGVFAFSSKARTA